MRKKPQNYKTERGNDALTGEVTIREIDADGVAHCYEIRPETRARDAGYFERCFAEHQNGARRLYIADYGGRPAGYAHLVFTPNYRPFRKMTIPEIQDLFVAPDFRQRGIGAALVGHCEAAAKLRGYTEIGIGVGLYRDYGAAQRLYVRRGYLPDGAGVVYENEQVTPGEMRAVDDFLCLKLVKRLS